MLLIHLLHKAQKQKVDRAKLIHIRCSHKLQVSSPHYTVVARKVSSYEILGLPANTSWFDIMSLISAGERKIMFTPSWLLSRYLKTSIGAFTGFQTEWKFINMKVFAHDETCYTMWRRVYTTKALSFFFTQRKDFIVLFTRLTYFRDPTALVPFIKKHLLQTHLKQHNRIFYSVSSFMASWYFFAANAQRIKGYTVFFKGKLAKKGSVRKSVFFKKKGAVSFTNKSLRVNYRNYFVWTYTGVIGAGLSIFYRSYVYICDSLHLFVFPNFRNFIFFPFCTPSKPWLY